MVIHIEVVRGSNCIVLEYDTPVLLSTVFAEHSMRVEMPCGGKQRCLKCKVQASGDLSPMGERESQLLTEQEKAAGLRYACMTEARGNVKVLLPDAAASDRIVTAGEVPPFTLNPWGKTYGVAVDIGTTTVALYLYDLKEGRQVGSASERNPQALFGADVISRIERSLAGDGPALAASIRECISRMMTTACKESGVPLAEIDSVVLTGNTAMLYLLCDESPASIAAAPFEQDDFFGRFLPASELGLPLPESTRVYLPRCISAYVGADITTALMAAGYDKQIETEGHAPELLVDIGTNGEMVLAAGGKLFCCSTAAGPAFEGAGIFMGMNAKEGAISKVKFTNGAILCSVIGEGEAKGICGSGIVDVVAVMVKAGILEESGLINQEDHDFVEYITEADGQVAFRLPGTQVVVTQKDIRSIQLAKSAICAGMTTLIAEAGLKPEDVHRLSIAGGFGAFIDVEAAETIGLIPPHFAAKSRAIGNAAGAGASMCLLSEEVRRRAEAVAESAMSLELSTSPRFMDAYVDNMMFGVE